MSKFSREIKKKERKVILSITIEPSAIEKIQDIHDNVSQWVRNAIEEKLIRDLPINNKIKGA